MEAFVHRLEMAGQDVAFLVCRKPRIRGVKIRLAQDGSCVVTISLTCTVDDMERLLLQHQAWFAKHMTRLEKRGLAIKPHNPQQHRRDYLLYKERARQLVQRRVTELNQRYEFLYKRIAIKNLRSKWASCSSKGNLNFHYQVVLLPDDLLDYLVVHELCHLQEQNHSVRFWTLVGQVIPDWRKKRLELKRWHPPSVS